MRRLTEIFCGNEAFCLVSMDGRARAIAEGPAIELAWGRQAIDCLGNEKAVGTYKRRDIRSWELGMGRALDDGESCGW
jgi:hypothetical protein